MRRWADETEAREEIKDLVAQYYLEFKKKEQDKEFCPGDRLVYTSRVYDER